MLTLPIDPRFVRQRFSIALGGRRYVIRVYWEERPQAWRIDLLTSSDEPIVVGRRIAPNDWPLRGLVDDRSPDGGLFAWDTDGTEAPIGPTDLGSRVQIVFASREELADIIETLTGVRPTTATGGLAAPGGELVG